MQFISQTNNVLDDVLNQTNQHVKTYLSLTSRFTHYKLFNNEVNRHMNILTIIEME